MNSPLSRRKRSYLALQLCLVVAAVVVGVVFWQTLGPLSRHMIGHIVLMAVVAPLGIWLLHGPLEQLPSGLRAPGVLWLLCIIQLLVFLFWHTPQGMAWAMSGVVQSGFLQVSLFLCACAFWAGIRLQASHHRWHAVLALLFTGKLFCLVALLLVFSPRFLYGASHHAMSHAATMADQHLAGSLMIVLCPLVYVLSAVLILGRWLFELSDPGRSAGP